MKRAEQNSINKIVDFLGRMAGESLSSLFFEFGETNEVQKKNKHMHGGDTAAVGAALAAAALCGG